MRDLNSVLLEGIVLNVKSKRDKSGIWVELKNRKDKEQDLTPSHSFRIAIKDGLRGFPPSACTIGRRIRVVGVERRIKIQDF